MRPAVLMDELADFYNDGFGWVCRPCSKEASLAHPEPHLLPRFMREGEAESKSPELANRSLAKWADAAQTTLMCPRCGITELLSKS